MNSFFSPFVVSDNTTQPFLYNNGILLERIEYFDNKFDIVNHYYTYKHIRDNNKINYHNYY